MKSFKISFCSILIGLMLLVNLQINLMPTPAMAAEETSENKPQVWLGPEVEIKSKTSVKSDKDKTGWFAKNKWWVALGAVLVGGTAAALAAGGGSGGEDEGTGTYNNSW
jgi:hypothetical protein